MAEGRWRDSLPHAQIAGVLAVAFGGLTMAQALDISRDADRLQWGQLVITAFMTIVWTLTAWARWRDRPRRTPLDGD